MNTFCDINSFYASFIYSSAKTVFGQRAILERSVHHFLCKTEIISHEMIINVAITEFFIYNSI